MARSLHDDSLLADILTRDRVHGAYALCDLDPPYRQHTDFFTTDEPSDVLVMVYSGPAFSAVWMTGHPVQVADVCSEIDLPNRFHVIIRPEYQPLLCERYRFAPDPPTSMVRMVVTEEWFVPCPALVERVGEDVVDELDRFYQGRVAAWDPEMTHSGFYYVVREEGEIAAAAGTHVTSKRFGIAGVGNVFTAPFYRRRGAASALTSAVVAALLPVHPLVFLNVAVINTAAIQIYERLGFRIVERLVEAVVTRDDGGSQAAGC